MLIPRYLKYRVFFFALIITPTANAQLAKDSVLLCTPKSQANWRDDGTIVVGVPSGLWRDDILIDLRSALVRQPPSGKPQTYWRIVQEGDDNNDWVLMHFFDPSQPLNQNLGRLSNYIFRIRSWEKLKLINFSIYSVNFFWSGTCQTIK